SDLGRARRPPADRRQAARRRQGRAEVDRAPPGAARGRGPAQGLLPGADPQVHRRAGAGHGARRARQPGGARAWPVPPRRRVTDARGTCRSDHAVARLEALAGGAAGALAAGARPVSTRRRTRSKEDPMMNPGTAVDDRDPMDPVRMASLKHWGELPEGTGERMTDEAKVDCGWG